MLARRARRAAAQWALLSLCLLASATGSPERHVAASSPPDVVVTATSAPAREATRTPYPASPAASPSGSTTPSSATTNATPAATASTSRAAVGAERTSRPGVIPDGPPPGAGADGPAALTASPPSTALASTTASSPPTAPVSTSAPALTTVSPPPTAGSSSTTESPPTQGTPVVPTTPPTPATAPTTAPPLVTAATTASTAAAATTDASSSGSPPTLTAYSGDGFLQRSRLEGGGPLEALQTPLQSPSPPPGLAVTVEVDKLPRLPGATATEATTLADAKVTPTATLFNLAENVISGFAVMVLQSQVHVDEPGAVDGKHADQKANHLLEDLVFKPEPMHFATPNNTVVLAQRGTTAYLPCVIKNIADGLVTWLRRRDHHLLTVARGGYAQDERFQVVHDKHPEDWTMQLKFVTDRDTGRYECQVSTHPPVSIYIHLKVVEARCAIEGPVEKFVRSGSQLRLVCHIDQCTTEPEFMFWYKDGIMVNFDQHNVYQVVVDLPNNTTVLVVERVTRAQTGNYTCEAAQAKPTSISLHVISGENPAAMQTGGGGIAQQPLWLLALLVVTGVRLALG